jgi:formate dehydrogenase subunit gamma
MMQTVMQLVAPESAEISTTADSNSKILRFAKSERVLHWAIAGPFLLSFATGAILVIVYNPDPSRPLRTLLAAIHRCSGIALTILPIFALLSARHDWRIHIYNIKQAWTWIYDDFKWLALMGLAAISSKFVLPEQGKFNAAEKLNFMVLMSTYPLYIVTGLLMWLIPLAVISWIMHCLMAMMATPLVLGHLYMALINAETSPGLEGMISGHVDRQWAKHHYRRWYRRYFEEREDELARSSSVADPDPSAVYISRALLEDRCSRIDGSSLVVPQLIMNAVILGHPFRFPPQAAGGDEEFYGLWTVACVVGGITGANPVGDCTSTKLTQDQVQYELSPRSFIGLCDRFRKASDARSLLHGIKRADLIIKSGERSEPSSVHDKIGFASIFASTELFTRVVMVRSRDCVLLHSLPEDRGCPRFKSPELVPNPARLAKAASPNFSATEFRDFPVALHQPATLRAKDGRRLHK